MNYNEVKQFFIGLFIDIGISLLLGFGATATIIFALIYVMSYIPSMYRFVKNYKVNKSN